ncbi:hypothetical protein [Actinoplanes sp. NPDC049118]|uniref:hypothetical protein n=1 Tax=Actinoplanes sp. NPDC049118 TaxID=3155769 RepID=UPI0033D21917
MGRILGFTTLAGMNVGGATGAVFTPFGLVVGAVVGLVLGLLAGLFTGGMVMLDRSGLTPAGARLLVGAPPIIVLALATVPLFIYDALHEGSNVPTAVALVSVVVGTPLIVTVTWTGAPWCVAPLAPGAADESARRRMVRGMLWPVWVGGLLTAGWCVAIVATAG